VKILACIFELKYGYKETIVYTDLNNTYKGHDLCNNNNNIIIIIIKLFLKARVIFEELMGPQL